MYTFTDDIQPERHTWRLEIRPVALGPVQAVCWVKAATQLEALDCVKRSDATAQICGNIDWPGDESDYVYWEPR